MHPAAKLKFERVVHNTIWRIVAEEERSPAAAWWWQPAFQGAEQHEERDRTGSGNDSFEGSNRQSGCIRGTKEFQGEFRLRSENGDR
jgi:hypothetical protein